VNRVAVVGAGPAGVVAASVFARHGFRPLLVDPAPSGGARTRPQIDHAHIISAEVAAELESHVPFLNLDGGRAADRASLDRVLWSAVCRSGFERIVGRIKDIEFTDGLVRISDLAHLDFIAVIDATGASRATTRTLPRSAIDALGICLGDARHAYASFHLTPTTFDRRQNRLVSCSVDKEIRAILAVGNVRAILTVQFPKGEYYFDSFEDILTALARFPDRTIFSLCQSAAVQAGPFTFAPRAPSCIDCRDDGQLPSGWLPIGDALLCTPPTYALGFWQLARQASILDDGLRNGRSFARIRRNLFDAALAVWGQIVLQESLYPSQENTEWQ
jgi:hypothetical protein